MHGIYQRQVNLETCNFSLVNCLECFRTKILNQTRFNTWYNRPRFGD